MAAFWKLLGDNSAIIGAAALVGLSWLVGLVARRVLLTRLRRSAETNASARTDWLLNSFGRHTLLWSVVGGLYAALSLIDLRPDLATLLRKVLLSLLIVSFTTWVASLVARFLERQVTPGTSTAVPAVGVMRHVARIAVLALGGLVLFSSLGISITPLLTTVGIGGLAVALGLQETLSNLFAGIQITLAGNIGVGDFIRLESGEEGYIDDIHWRATRVRTLPNNFVLIPNSRLAQSVITNYHRPSKDLAVLVEVGVHYSSDLDQVERVTTEVASSVMRAAPGGVADFHPFIRYHTFADSSINFTVILRAQEFADRFLVKHEFIKALARAYATAGIVIPFPIRALDLTQEKASHALGLISELGPRPE